jgi:hypothetical protein
MEMRWRDITNLSLPRMQDVSLGDRYRQDIRSNMYPWLDYITVNNVIKYEKIDNNSCRRVVARSYGRSGRTVHRSGCYVHRFGSDNFYHDIGRYFRRHVRHFICRSTEHRSWWRRSDELRHSRDFSSGCHCSCRIRSAFSQDTLEKSSKKYEPPLSAAAHSPV